jgi:hypothetical protein
MSIPEVHVTITGVEMDEQGVPRVNRGTPVTVDVRVDHRPPEIYFAYLPPGEEMPVVDDGIDQPDSKIVRVEDESTSEIFYRYVIRTTGWHNGLAWWHMWGVDDDGNETFSEFGWFEIGVEGTDQPAPDQLL